MRSVGDVMNVWGVTMVKDEADVIAGTLTHLAEEGVTGIIVADNGSTDDTRKILDTIYLGDCELVILDDDEPGYYQSEKMSALAAQAADRGAEWVVPFDADELWTGPDRLPFVLSELPAYVNVAAARLFNHFPTAIDPEGDPFESIVWRQLEPAPLAKVAFRWEPGAVIHQGNHGVTLRAAQVCEVLEVRHFPYRSAEQFIRKARNGAAAYAATSLDETVGQHWRGYGTILERYGEDALADVFREYFHFLAPFESGLIYDPAPYRRWRS